MVHRILSAAVVAGMLAAGPAVAQHQKPAQRPQAPVLQRPQAPVLQRPQGPLLTLVSLADIGFGNGFRFSNLSGRREVFVPLPQGAELTATELQLVIDDVSAHEARRNLEILVNDRSTAAIALDGKSAARILRVPVARARPHDGFLKLTFLYSGAATQDRCIDVRSVGDSLTVRPESAIEIEIGAGPLDVANTAALLPRDVAIVLPERKLSPTDVAAALTIARALKSSGRRVSFHRGSSTLPALTRREDPRRLENGIVVIGTLDDVTGYLDAPVATLAGPLPALGSIAAIRLGGAPALLITDSTAVRAGRLFASPALAATRGSAAATIGDVANPKPVVDRINFETLALVPAPAEVYGRAEIALAIPARALPESTRAARLVLDVIVAPDGAGEKAVVTTFVNERLLGSTIAASEGPTRMDLTLPEGLVGAIANIRVIVQRRSAQGDCRFEPQGYPAQILGSSALVLERIGDQASDFSDLAAFWANGVDILLPPALLERSVTGLLALTGILANLSADTAPITVRFIDDRAAAVPSAPFILVGNTPPAGSAPRVRFDRGRIAVADRGGHNLLDLGGLSGGAVVQIVNADKFPGLWVKPLAAENTLPAPPELRLDRGDVAFVDHSGVALTMSSARDALIRISYPDQVSWLTIAERFRSWLIGALWLVATVIVLFGLQRMIRRRQAGADG